MGHGNLGHSQSQASHRAHKNIKKSFSTHESVLDWVFIWEKLCDELMKIYMIKSISPPQESYLCQFSTNLEMVNCQLGPIFGAKFQHMWKMS